MTRAASLLCLATALCGATADFEIGDKVPDVTIDQPTGEFGFPPNKLNLREYTAGRKVILMGLPGAFTPTWSSVQIPGYLEKQDALAAAGVEEVMLFAVNDAAVMKAWEKDQDCEASMINFYGDPDGELTKALGLVLDAPGPMSKLGYPRCKRFAMYITDGVIKSFHLSESPDDPAGDDHPEESCAPSVLATIEKLEHIMPKPEL